MPSIPSLLVDFLSHSLPKIGKGLDDSLSKFVNPVSTKKPFLDIPKSSALPVIKKVETQILTRSKKKIEAMAEFLFKNFKLQGI